MNALRLRTVAVIVVFSSLLVLLAGCGTNAKTASKPQASASATPQSTSSATASPKKDSGKIVLRYAELDPKSNPMAMVAEKLASIVKQKSNGQLEIKVYPGGQLGDQKTVIQSLQMGAIDMMRADTSAIADFGDKEIGVYNLPYIIRDRSHLWDVIKSPLGNQLLDSIQKSGTKLVGIGYTEEGARNFFFRNKDVKTVAGLKGLKIRVPQQQMFMDMVSTFGASPTPIAYSELYSALQTGVVDGAENPITGYLSNHFYEVAKHYTLDAHEYSPAIILMSEMVWNKLSKKDQDILKQAATEVESYNRTLMEKSDQQAMKELKAKGVIINQVTDKAEWQKAAQPLYQKYGKDYMSIIKQIEAVK